MDERPTTRDADGSVVVEDALRCAAELHMLGERIDTFRRRGAAAIGGEPGPEVPTLRDRQTELVERFLQRAAGVGRDHLDAARHRLRAMYARGHDLVTGRALTLVETALDHAGRERPEGPVGPDPRSDRGSGGASQSAAGGDRLPPEGGTRSEG